MQLISTSASAARRQLVHAAANLGAGNSVMVTLLWRAIPRFFVVEFFFRFWRNMFLGTCVCFCFISRKSVLFVGIVWIMIWHTFADSVPFLHLFSFHELVYHGAFFFRFFSRRWLATPWRSESCQSDDDQWDLAGGMTADQGGSGLLRGKLHKTLGTYPQKRWKKLEGVAGKFRKGTGCFFAAGK